MTELKSGWKRWRFEQIAQNVAVRVDDPVSAGVEYYVGLAHLDSDSLRIRRWGAPADVSATKLLFEPGDVIFGRRRAYQRKLGVAHFRGIASAHALVLRAKPQVVHSSFLPYFLQSDFFMERAQQISVGSLSPTVNWKTLARQEFAIPPLEEQTRIARAMAAFDTHATDLLEVRERLQTLLHATIDAAYEGRLRIGDVSSGTEWPTCRLDELTTKIVDGVHKTPKYVEAGVPFLAIENLTSGNAIDFGVTRFITQADHEEFSKRAPVEDGDVLVSKDGTLGVARVVENAPTCSIFVSLALLKPKPRVLDPWYLRFFFDSRPFLLSLAANSSGSALKHIHLAEFRGLPLPTPPIEVQRAIAGILRTAHAGYLAAFDRYQSCLSVRRRFLRHVLEGERS